SSRGSGQCPYCNLQLRSPQDVLADIRAVNTSLMAVSPQSPDHSLSVTEKHDLEFPVLSDVDQSVIRAYRVPIRSGRRAQGPAPQRLPQRSPRQERRWFDDPSGAGDLHHRSRRSDQITICQDRLARAHGARRSHRSTARAGVRQ
ncbi:MAG TPA: hypothetical protein DCX12_06150, partial [Chloroflexi bacterium]|nr:hypothetical protein [Chloroflexota bacterium]